MVKRKRTYVPIRTFETVKKFDDFVQDEKLWMYDRIYKSIKKAIESGNDIAHVAKIKIEDVNATILVDSDKIEWLYILNIVLNGYESEEMYEKCIQVRDLIELIKKNNLNL